MSARVDALVSAFEKYKGNYRLQDKLREAARDHGGAEPGPDLWRAFQDGRIDLGADRNAWYLLHEAPDDLKGEDVLAFVRAASARYPGGYEVQPGGYRWYALDDSMPPGNLEPAARLIADHQRRPALAAPLKAGWADLPDPFRVAVGYYLAKAGIIPWTDLPRAAVLDLARVRLRKGRSDTERWAEGNPVPADEWGKALVEAGLTTPDLTYEHADVLLEMLPYATPDQLAQLVQKAGYNWHTREAIPKLDGALPAAFWEKLARELPPMAARPRHNATSGPEFLVLLCWLRACRAEGLVPTPELDGALQGLLDSFQRGWSGSGETEEDALIRESLGVIPQDRLERLILKTTSLDPYLYYAACPTPAVLRSAVDWLTSKGKPGYKYEQQRLVERLLGNSYYQFKDGLLRPLLGALAPYATAALKKKGGENRDVLVRILADSGSPDAAEGLALALAESAKGSRETARAALARLGETALPHIKPLLSAKKKDLRLEAASVLAALPASAAVASAAAEALKDEKLDDIRRVLGGIQAPQAGGGDADAIRAALAESGGARWTEFVDMGPGLVEIYWSYLEKTHSGDHVNYTPRVYGEGPHTRWLDAVARFKEDAGVRERAALAAAAFADWRAKEYLNELHDALGDAGPALAAVIAAGRFARPVAIGKARYGSFEVDDAIAWLAEKSPAAGLPAFAWGMVHKLKRVQSASQAAILNIGAPAAGALYPLLACGRAEIEALAAETLAAIGAPDAAERLEEALPKSRAKEAIQAAIAKLRAAGLDVSRFPATAEGDAALDAALAGLPAAPPHAFLGKKQLPPLKWRTGAPLSAGARAWVIGALSEESEDTRTPLLWSVRPRLDDAACWALSEKLVEHLGFFDQGWALYAQAVVGSPEQIQAVGARLEDLASSQRTRWGTDGVECLVRHGSDDAIRILDHWARKSRRDALRGRASSGLRRMADARGVSVPELIDSAISDFGFDASGEQTLDYGPRKFTVKLGAENEVEIFDADGKPVKALPDARKDEDAAVVAALKKRVADMKKQIKALHATQLARLELALASGRTWPIDTWIARFERHPLMHAFSRRLLWQVVGADGAPGPSFALTEEGERLGADLEPAALPAAGSVRLLHPIDLPDETRAAWAAYLADAGVVQPFPQLDRPVYRAADLEPAPWRGLPEAPAARFRQRLVERGWEKDGREDAGLINGAAKQYGEYSVSISNTGWSPEWMDGDPVEITGLHAWQSGESIDWKALPGRILSELAYDLRRLVSG